MRSINFLSDLLHDVFVAALCRSSVFQTKQKQNMTRLEQVTSASYHDVEESRYDHVLENCLLQEKVAAQRQDWPQ